MASHSFNSATADICSLALTVAVERKRQNEFCVEITERELKTYTVYKLFCWREALDVATSASSADKIADTLAKKYADAAECSAEDFAAILIQDWKKRHNVLTEVLPPEPDTVSAPTDVQSDVLPPNVLPPEPNAVHAQSAADETALPSEPAPKLGAAQPMWCLPVVCATQPLPQLSAAYAPIPQETPVCRAQFAALKQSARGIFDLLGFCLALSPMPPCPGMSASQPSTDPELLTVQPAQPPPYDSAQ